MSLGILSDAPLAHFRRVLEKLIEAEQAGEKPPAAAASEQRVPSVA